MKLAFLARGAPSASPVAQVLITVALTIGSMVLEHYAEKWLCCARTCMRLPTYPSVR